jgi:hypothetical protein
MVKSLAVVAVSLYLRDWWMYGAGSSGARGSEVVQSCSSVNADQCYSFCGDVIVVEVNITDDRAVVDDLNVPPQLHNVQSSSVDLYCIANLPGYCAYDFWLLFTLVPLMLHLVQLNLQLLAWWWCQDFSPQQRQYDTVIMHLYPQVCAAATAGAATGAGGGVVLGRRPGAAVDGADYRSMIRQLQSPVYYSVFAFIEIVTVLYVWGELQFPSTFCGAVRPLSLYYYPVLMTLLDLTKFNIYVAAQYAYRGLYAEAALALLNAEMFLSNLWITTALAGLFVAHGVLGAVAWGRRVLCGGADSESAAVQAAQTCGSGDDVNVDVGQKDLESPAVVGAHPGMIVHVAGNPLHISNLSIVADHLDDDEPAGRGVRLASAVTTSGRTEWGKSRDTFG